ncbi:hypothetical protein C8N32_11076 [Rhodovulum imhoffii]|uniref:Uncharacterized protein n=1 Tax=Rhodovulum imhoffii TaxID=365340 RepID=A0A2T5BRB8_9RHOB|nr:iron-containing alcohol dehydrogenase [Rhodovulum imhoffii]MBK5934448.1 alcohol dehydrogenase [Rhodovulum imhoffii]PTN01795.1 hypothetical protein C8N32_11076 [Rhodovulum imhoffii]
MTPFAFQTAGRVRFGRGVASQAVPEARARGDRVLIVHGRSTARAAPVLAGLKGAILLPCPAEPTLDMLDEALPVARAAGVEVVLGIGGGAVLDLAKALAALVPAPGQAMRYLEVVGEGQALDAAPLPFIAVPTTAGTGAEVTRNAVIGVPGHRRKVSLRDDRMLADLALVDPALADGTPRAVTLASGLDAVTQVIEPYLSCRANPVTDALCAAMIPRGFAALRRLMETEDAAARDDMALVSLTGGMALTNAGLGAVHGLAGVIGGVTGAAHGAICGALLPHVLSLNETVCRTLGQDTHRFEQIRTWIGGGYAEMADWAHGAGLPCLSDLGVTPDNVPEIARAASMSSSMKGNPAPLSPPQLETVLRSALGGQGHSAGGLPACGGRTSA